MRAVVLDKYTSFQCLAGACTSTCCAGWSILVDQKDYERFENLEPEWLRQDILANIFGKGKKYFFKNQKDGRCAMLDVDGLCRIQRNTSEDTLCNTCRKYPRIINSLEGVVYLSMAASCPVISEYLVRDSVEWQVIEVSGKVRKIAVEELAFTEGIWHLYQELWQAADRLLLEHSNASLLYQSFEMMAAEVLNIIIQYSEGSIPVNFFQALETDVSEQIVSFMNSERVRWGKILNNYMKYRIISRKMEYPSEDEFKCIIQVQGELLLLRLLAFCRYCEKNVLFDTDWQDLLQRVYRFCVHGKRVSEAFRNFLESCFSQNVLWSYLLK